MVQFDYSHKLELIIVVQCVNFKLILVQFSIAPRFLPSHHQILVYHLLVKNVFDKHKLDRPR
jgi:hypothetical protein